MIMTTKRNMNTFTSYSLNELEESMLMGGCPDPPCTPPQDPPTDPPPPTNSGTGTNG